MDPTPALRLDPARICGTVVLRNAAGRSLRRQAAAVHVADVLYWSGDFTPGDAVYVTFLGADGGQYVVAAGVVDDSAEHLDDLIGLPWAAANDRPPIASRSVLIRAENLHLLWPTRH